MNYLRLHLISKSQHLSRFFLYQVNYSLFFIVFVLTLSFANYNLLHIFKLNEDYLEYSVGISNSKKYTD